MGLSKTNVALFATGMYGVVKMLSSMCFLIFAADSLGRRKSLLISSVGMTVSLYVVGTYEKVATGRSSEDKVSCARITHLASHLAHSYMRLTKNAFVKRNRSHLLAMSRSCQCIYTCCESWLACPVFLNSVHIRTEG